MKPGTALVAILFASASFTLLAQQPTSPSAPGSSASHPTTQQAPPAAESAPQNSPAANPETSAAPMSPVNGELVSKLDSKTAKAGDDVVLQTKASVKTADGTEIPNGSKLLGHVVAVQPSGEGANSQVVLEFDHLQLKGGQNLAVHSQIQSIALPEGVASASGKRDAAPSGHGAPAAGTVVAKNGNIAIQTTSIPGILLANNAPGQQDPRMAKASSILLGAKTDIQLDSGTQVVVGVSAASGGGQ